jgi:hypothetical protein
MVVVVVEEQVNKKERKKPVERLGLELSLHLVGLSLVLSFNGF